MARTKAQQRDETMRALVDEGALLFAERGYAAVGLAEIVRAAGVTKGALYHHFGSKEGLFRAVLRRVQHEVADQVAAAADTEPDTWSQLTAGCRAFLTASSGPAARRIMLVDAPAVLGWNEWRAMDEAASARHLGEALEALFEDGSIPEQPVAPLVRLLSGAMNESALWIAQSENPDALDDTVRALTRLLQALRTS